VNWNMNYYLKDYGFFLHACNLNKTIFKRGFKLLSGTGHQEYMLNAPQGTIANTYYLTPWEISDFLNFIRIQSWPEKLQNILSNEAALKLFPNLLMNVTGTVPRDVQQFITYLDTAEHQSYKLNPFDTLKEYLKHFEERRLQDWEFVLGEYMKKKGDDIDIFCQNILDALLSFTNQPIPHNFLDLSVLYWVERTSQYFPVTPVASKALISLIRNTSMKNNEYTINLLDKSVDPTERGLAFERVIAKMIFLKGVSLKTTRLDGSDEKDIGINCIFSHSFSNVNPIPDKVYIPTIFIPPRNYPAGDLIIVSQDKVVMIQVTTRPPYVKIPSKGTSYSAIYDAGKYKTLQLGTMPPGKNFAEAFLNLITHQSIVNVDIKDEEVKIIVGEDCLTKKIHVHNLVDRNGNPVSNFFYIIISSSELYDTPWYKKQAIKYPWVRVVDRKNLVTILPEPIIALLPKSDSKSTAEKPKKGDKYE